MSQSYSNHKKYVPGFHFVLAGIILVLLIGSIINIVHIAMNCKGGNCSPMGCCCLYDGLMPLLTAVSLLLFFAYTRQFVVKVQDRAIMAEESLRYFMLAGKRFDPRLKRRQIIALRFASDDEYVALMQRAIDEQLSANEIKKAIKNWRTDDHRA